LGPATAFRRTGLACEPKDALPPKRLLSQFVEQSLGAPEWYGVKALCEFSERSIQYR
jgi:hypothetical protein